jgi:septal ring factor EnvC (AmiA/AmiB activator)
LLRQLYAIDALRFQHERDLGRLNAELRQIEDELAAEEAFAARLESEVPIRGARLAQRIAVLYRLGRAGFWKVLLTSDSYRQFVRRYRLLRQIVQRDAELLTQHRTQLQALREKRASLEQRRGRVLALRQQVGRTTVNVEVEKRKKLFLLEEIRRDKTLAARLARDLAQQNTAMNQTLAALPSPTPTAPPGRPLRLDFASRQGNLPLPVAGPIVGRFGMRLHQEFGTQTRSNGIDIAVPAGTPVRAVADGTVSHIGEFLGYGRVLIVDHGQRYHTLYGHLGAFTRTKGDIVYQGDVVGTVGGAGLYAEPVLHFEIRSKGAAVDPLLWLSPTP